MEQDIKELLEIICEMGNDAEISDLAYVENVVNKYGFTIGEDLRVEWLANKGLTKKVLRNSSQYL